jgi:CO/xanthine dehydrogenase Mo-binding subunit
MQLAEALGIPYESVKPQVADTDTVGYTDVTGGSRTTFATGIAAIEAAQDVIVQLKQHAARIWSLNEEDKDKVRYDTGTLYGPGDNQKLSFEQIASQVMRGGAPVVGRATVSPKTVGMAYACHIVDLEVDVETGKTEILRYTALQDAGKAIHPSYVEGQMQGGVAQGVGWALNEEYVYDPQGRLANSNFLDYRMPTALDLPMIDTVIVEVPHPGHPYGVRGVGEAPIVPPLAAVANAMSRALDHRFTALPISPRRVVEETVLPR